MSQDLAYYESMRQPTRCRSQCNNVDAAASGSTMHEGSRPRLVSQQLVKSSLLIAQAATVAVAACAKKLLMPALLEQLQQQDVQCGQTVL